MLERLQKLLRAVSPGTPAKARFVFDEADHRVAAAGLLIHAMNADGVKSPAEETQLEALLRERFSLDEAELHALIATAQARQRESLDFNTFARIIKRAYDEDGRLRIVEMMWEIVFADGSLHEFEDNLVWRVADVIGVPPASRGAIRSKVAQLRGIDLAEMND
jgi:uncharacterized tellurite resistance protein B-like protein